MVSKGINIKNFRNLTKWAKNFNLREKKMVSKPLMLPYYTDSLVWSKATKSVYKETFRPKRQRKLSENILMSLLKIPNGNLNFATIFISYLWDNTLSNCIINKDLQLFHKDDALKGSNIFIISKVTNRLIIEKARTGRR